MEKYFLAPAVPHGVPAVKPPIVHQNATGVHPGTPTGAPPKPASNTPHSPGTLQIKNKEKKKDKKGLFKKQIECSIHLLVQ